MNADKTSTRNGLAGSIGRELQGRKTGLLIGAAIGSGISAQTAARGGVDFLLAVNAGRMRNMAAPSIASMLPCHHASALTADFARREVLPRVDVPVLLGVNCWDPDFDPVRVVNEVGAMGFAGAVNFPNTTLMPRGLGHLLDGAGRGYRAEIDLLSRFEDAGLLSLYYCGTTDHAEAAAQAGLGMILLNFGWNSGVPDGHSKRASLEEVGVVARHHARLIRRINPKAKLLLEGGPVVSADDLGHVAAAAALDGYVGGSTLDRLPFEESVLNRVASYRQAADRRRELTKRQGGLVRWAAHHGIVGSSPALLDCLDGLRALSRVRRSVALTVEPGTPIAPLLSALSGGTDWPQIDMRESDERSRLARRLFGRDESDETETGLLTDGRTEVVVLRNVHLAPPRVQRRLAASLSQGTLITSRRRRRLHVSARCIFLFDVESVVPSVPDTMAGDMADYLSGWTVSVPPLRDRVADMTDLIAAVARTAGIVPGRVPSLSPGAMQCLRRHPWPGNEAELERVVGRMAVAVQGRRITDEETRVILEDRAGLEHGNVSSPDLERRRIVEALWRNDFHRGRTAEALHITRKTLYNRMQKFGLNG